MKYNEWLSNGKNREDWNQYVIIRNEYNHLIKTKKGEYTKSEIRNAANNQNKMWKCLRSLISNKSLKTSHEINFGNENMTDPQLIANKFNEYFINSIVLLNSQIPESNDQTHNTIEVLCENDFNLQKVSIEEEDNSAKELKEKINKAEYCNSMVWYDSMEYTADFLKSIINEIFETGKIPYNWKILTVTPIPKIKNTNQFVEFRPINTMENDEKIMESIVKSQFIKHIETNNLLTKTQSAFRAKHSC